MAATPDRGVPVDHRPTVIAAAVAVVLAAGGAVTVAGHVAYSSLYLYTALGALFLVAGAGDAFRDAGIGRVLTGLGVVLVLGSVWVLVNTTTSRTGVAVAYPALAGVVVVGLALRPLRAGWEAKLATLGAGLVLAAVLLAGVTYRADRLSLLLGVVGVVAAWDAARYATTLGQQIGRQATTRRAEGTHVVATLCLGAAFVAAAELLWSVGVSGLPLEGVLVFLGAAVAFLVVLYH